ncbi:hypothetical protein [Aquibacillus kalidii]|uniref:hypothetical protein n=1 Tax=Aquibacillus kalidii TaxID=2762597 RepID=UPI001645FF38|nr:hypothetical protein [Aquibacillus kalidii]
MNWLNKNDLALLLSGITTVLICAFVFNPLIKGPIDENVFTIVPVLFVILIILTVLTSGFRRLLGPKNKTIGKGYFALSVALLAIFITVMKTLIL